MQEREKKNQARSSAAGDLRMAPGEAAKNHAEKNKSKRLTNEKKKQENTTENRLDLLCEGRSLGLEDVSGVGQEGRP